MSVLSANLVTISQRSSRQSVFHVQLTPPQTEEEPLMLRSALTFARLVLENYVIKMHTVSSMPQQTDIDVSVTLATLAMERKETAQILVKS